MILCDIFPTAIAIERLEIDTTELNTVLALANDTDKFIANQNGNFFHDEVYIFDTVLKDSKLAADVQKSIDQYTVDVFGEDPAIKYTQSWININPPGSSHHMHSHVNSIISGVLYLQTNDNSGKFLVHRADERSIRNLSKTHNKYNYEYLFFDPKPFDLFLFPSCILHSVEQNKSNSDRISLSFNTFYHGKINATKSKLTELKIN